MPPTFSVTVAKEYLTFSAAHFITIAGHQCERLHGHNYRLGVSVAGEVDRETGFVVDFGVIKQVVRPLIQAVDHRVLLPTRNAKLRYAETAEQVEVTYHGARRYIFPRNDVVMVPVSDTTAELLAEYFAAAVAAALAAEGARLAELTVEVEESVGQSAGYRVDLASGGSV
jgi:6-pyruvoyltetrahydropterin/6-carboxytetrahydropterin synthase